LNEHPETIPLTGERLVIGRGSRCDVVVTDPCASRRHAELLLSDQQWLISDLGSRNGTLVNGRRVGQEQVLRSGDTIAIASGTWTFLLGDDPLATIESEEDNAAEGRSVRLSPRELEVMVLVAGGATDQQIAGKLFVSVSTVRSHLDRMRDKTGCRRRSQLTRFALDLGLEPPEGD